MSKNSRAFLKALSQVLANLSGAWFALAIVTSSFGELTDLESIMVLTRHILLGILFLALTAFVERRLQ